MPRNATLTFDDGSQHVYNGVPDEVTPEMMTARAANDFPGKQVRNIDGGRSAQAPSLPPEYQPLADFALGNALQVSQAAVKPLPPPDRAGELITGANKGIASMVGAPVDIIASALEGIAKSRNIPYAGIANPMGNVLPTILGALGQDHIVDPLGGSESIKKGMKAVGVPFTEPVDRQGRVASRVVEEIAASLVPTGLLLRAGAKAKAANRVDPQSFVAPFAPTVKSGVAGNPATASLPYREIGNQTALATSAGTGAAAAREVTGDNPIGDIIGALVGSQVGSQTAKLGRIGFETGRNVLDPKRMGRQEAGERLVDAMFDKTVDPETGKVLRAGDNIFGDTYAESKALERDVPGLKLSTGEATTDPGLQAVEFQRRSGGPSVARYKAQEQGNQQAVKNALGEIEPRAATDEATRTALEKRGQRAVDTANVISNKRASEAADTRAATEPPLSRAEAGEIIRKEIESQTAAGRSNERDLWKSIDPEGQSQYDTGSLRARAQKLLDDTPRTESPKDTPETVKEIAGKTDAPELTGRSIDPELMAEATKAEGKSLLRDAESVDELLALKTRLSEEIRAERAADAPNRNRMRKLSVMLDEVMTTLETGATKSAANAEAKAAVDKATAASRELNERFTRGVAADVTAVDARGRVKVENSELPGKFFKGGANGTPEAIADFERAVGGGDEARKALRSYALDDARRAAFRDGKVDAKALDAWITKHKDALEAYPAIRDELGSVSSAQKALERAQRREGLLKDSVSDPKKSTVAKYLDREDARDSISAIMDGKNPRREMTNLVNSLKGDAEALDGARRAFWDRMMEGRTSNPREGVRGGQDAKGDDIVRNAAMRNFLQKYGDQAAILYRDNPEHLKRLERIAEAVAAGERTTNIKPRGTSGTPLGTVPGLTLAGLTSRGYAIARGVVSLPYVILETGTRAARRRYLKIKGAEVERLMDDALLDPEVAKTMVMEWNEANQKVIAKRLRTHLGHELDVAAADQVDDDKRK